MITVIIFFSCEKFQESDAKVPAYWKSDNLTEIKLTGKRGKH